MTPAGLPGKQVPRTPVPGRVGYIDGLRALAALYVLLHHSWATIYPPAQVDPPDGLIGILTRWLLFGHVGVVVFIVLAGYSLTIGAAAHSGELRGGFFGFMLRRGRRILPPYWAAIAVTLVLSFTVLGARTGTQWDLSVPLDWRGVLANVFLVQDLTRTQDVSYTFWSIAVEWHIYLLFPPVLFVWRRSNALLSLAFGIALGAAAIAAARVFDPINALWPAFYVAFVLGMAARVLGTGESAVGRRIPWATAGVLLLGLAFIALGTHDYSWLVSHAKPVDLTIGLGVASILTALTLGRMRWLNNLLSARLLVTIGGFSYSIYLIHAPLLQVGWQALVQPFDIPSGGQLVIMLFVVAPATVGFAWIFFWFFERPFLSVPGARTPQSLSEQGR